MWSPFASDVCHDKPFCSWLSCRPNWIRTCTTIPNSRPNQVEPHKPKTWLGRVGSTLGGNFKKCRTILVCIIPSKVKLWQWTQKLHSKLSKLARASSSSNRTRCLRKRCPTHELSNSCAHVYFNKAATSSMYVGITRVPRRFFNLTT